MTTLRIFGTITAASAESRTLGGMAIRYGVPGRTSAGKLRVKPGALTWPDDLSRVKLTREHNRDESRGHLIVLSETTAGIRVVCKVADGADGDAALQEAADKTRDGFSYDVVDAQIVGDEIVAATVIAIGQVGIPAYEDTRIDQIAASQSNTPNTGGNMNADQIARLAALRAQESRSPEEESELSALEALEAAVGTQQAAAPAAPATSATASVAASIPAVATGLPTARSTTQVNEPNPLARFVTDVTAALATKNPAAISAALSDITHSDHTSMIEAPAWSGELWSGLQYEPIWTPLFNSGDLTNWTGKGWRFKTKPEIEDYAGDKAAIPSGGVETEDADYTAARMAVGHDIDRKFFDFPNEGFLTGLLEAVRESWAIKLDDKVRAYAIANAVAVPGLAAQPTLLKAAAKATRALKRRRVGRATFVAVNSDDFDTLLDFTNDDVPAFLKLFNIDPENFIDDEQIPAGTVIAGVKQAATVRTLPNSPIRVDAQNVANGGIDRGFFGYWAIEEHHTAGLAKVTYSAPVEEPQA